MRKPAWSSLRALIAALRSGDLRGLLSRYADIALALLVVLSVGMMIVPLPTFLLDLCITVNIAGAVTLLLVAIYVGDALKIATFPSLLLLATLFRLAIEISATRLILLRADAGQVIHAFGSFVVAGNLVVGVVVFVILTVIQYVVIAKGSARVAEVGARFTLDAMPGKQLSIDAELRAGHISHDEARQRRDLLARESQFFGSMDGAMKFVKGDAVAGIVVLLVNIVGGLLIGILQRGMDWGAALRTYTLLTVGEGLVAQIPALVISTAAGILVTRVSSEEEGGHLGGDIGRQLFAQPKALAVAAALLAVLAVVPGLPALPFLVLGALLGLVASRLLQGGPTVFRAGHDPPGAPLLVPIRIDLSPALAKELLPERGPSRLLAERLPALRERFFAETGITLPAIDVRVGAAAPDDYTIRLHEIPAATGTVARTPDGRGAAGQQAPNGPSAGEAIVEQLWRVLGRHGYRFVGIQETQVLLDRLERTHPALVREVVPKLLGPALLADVLQRLARERISLRNLADILTAIAKRGPAENDAAALAEWVRATLQRQITFQHAAPDGSVGVFLVDAMVEDTVREAIRKTPTGDQLALEPQLARDIVQAVQRAVTGTARPVILTAADVRRHLRGLLEPEHPEVAVLAPQELLPEAKLQTLGHITV
ncbi:MAG: FHIPEP family type III secretion protein [Deltaproteobacteria bacterium]|nr:FHIPEP family type III secretion protein [Deltaproteobacteria bacterium]